MSYPARFDLGKVSQRGAKLSATCPLFLLSASWRIKEVSRVSEGRRISKSLGLRPLPLERENKTRLDVRTDCVSFSTLIFGKV